MIFRDCVPSYDGFLVGFVDFFRSGGFCRRGCLLYSRLGGSVAECHLVSWCHLFSVSKDYSHRQNNLRINYLEN